MAPGKHITLKLNSLQSHTVKLRLPGTALTNEMKNGATPAQYSAQTSALVYKNLNNESVD